MGPTPRQAAQPDDGDSVLEPTPLEPTTPEPTVLVEDDQTVTEGVPVGERAAGPHPEPGDDELLTP